MPLRRARVSPWEPRSLDLDLELEQALAHRHSALKLDRTEPRGHIVSLLPRHGQAVWHDETRAGEMTSGTKSPTLGRYIGLAYVATGVAAPGTPVAIEIRGRRLPARVVDRPFYRRVRRED